MREFDFYGYTQQDLAIRRPTPYTMKYRDSLEASFLPRDGVKETIRATSWCSLTDMGRP